MLRILLLIQLLSVMWPNISQATTTEQALTCAEKVLQEAKTENLKWADAVERYVGFRTTASMVLLENWVEADDARRAEVTRITKDVFHNLIAKSDEGELDLESIKFGRAYPDKQTNTVVVPVRYNNSNGLLERANVWVLYENDRCWMADLEVTNIRWRFLVRRELKKN